MNISILQIYNNNIANYAIYSQLINSYYALQHNYIYLSWDYDLVPLERSVYYNKIVAVYKAMELNPQIEWFLYIDADAIITNNQIKIEEILARHPKQEIIFGTDRNGQNNGVFLIKNTPTMKQYLQDCYNSTKYINTKTPEQNAMFFTIADSMELQAITGWEPANFFNAYIDKYKDMQYDEPLWDNTSFILHLQKIDNKTRKKVFKDILRNNKIFLFSKE